MIRSLFRDKGGLQSVQQIMQQIMQIMYRYASSSTIILVI